MSEKAVQPAAGIAGKHFRGALGAFATGVTIVTSRDAEGRDVGLTANSFNSVSLDPPMVLWSLAKNSASLHAFMSNDHFAVHVLAADQQTLSDRFAKRGVDKFAELPVSRGVGDVPLLDGCSARFQCKTAYRYEGGDHMIFVGEVHEFDHLDHAPLVFHGGKYGKVLPKLAPKPDVGEEVESSFRKDFLGYLLGLASVQLHRPVRARCAELGVSDAVYYVLTVLMAQPDVTLEQVNTLMSYTGSGLSAELQAQMVDSGWVEISLTGSEKRLHLTSAGRQLAIQIFAVAKAAESAASKALDFEEASQLKQLLKRVIRATLDTGATELSVNS